MDTSSQSEQRSTVRLVDVYHVYREVTQGAIEFLYELMKERDPEINISHRALPTFEQHWQFVTRRPFRLWYLIEVPTGISIDTDPPLLPTEWIGYISATHANEIGIVLLKRHRGKGYGPAAIRELMRVHEPLPVEPSVRNGRWLANIAPANWSSKRIFQKLGFRLIAETYEFNEEEIQHGQETGKARSA